jgi:hypothetical protein
MSSQPSPQTTPSPSATDWHAIDAEQVAMKLETDPAEGLAADRIDELHARYGLNLLEERRSPPPGSCSSRSSRTS